MRNSEHIFFLFYYSQVAISENYCQMNTPNGR